MSEEAKDEARRSRPRSTACASPCSRSTSRSRPSRCPRCRCTQSATGEYYDAARPARGAGRLRRRPDPRRGQDDGPRPVPARRRDLRRPARRDDPLPGHQRGHHRRLAARVLDGHPPPDARRAAPAAPALPDAVDRHPRLLRRFAIIALLPGPGGLPRQRLLLRRAALLHDGARVGGRACGASSRTSRGPTAARATCASAATTRRCSRSSAARSPRSPSSSSCVLNPVGGGRRPRLAAARHRRLRRFPPPPGARPDDHRTRSRSRSRSSTTRPSTTPCSSARADGGYDEQLVATAGQARRAPAPRHPRARRRSPSRTRCRSTRTWTTPRRRPTR